VSLNNEKSCCEISEDKIAVCDKTTGLRRGRFLDLNTACSKVLVPVKIFQFQDMLNESERYRDAANGLCTCIRPVLEYAAAVFHHALPKYLEEVLERVQKRSLSIIYITIEDKHYVINYSSP
jgi:hypothetical protein